jgi:uncharacterized small protein (DUF1192 family)
MGLVHSDALTVPTGTIGPECSPVLLRAEVARLKAQYYASDAGRIAADRRYYEMLDNFQREAAANSELRDEVARLTEQLEEAEAGRDQWRQHALDRTAERDEARADAVESRTLEHAMSEQVARLKAERDEARNRPTIKGIFGHPDSEG